MKGGVLPSRGNISHLVCNLARLKKNSFFLFQGENTQRQIREETNISRHDSKFWNFSPLFKQAVIFFLVLRQSVFCLAEKHTHFSRKCSATRMSSLNSLHS